MVPTISCGASPSAHVTKDAFERIVKEMIDGIAGAGPLDAVYLDLHGAMVTEHFDDGEGEILARVRKVIGKDLPLVVSLDLHANVTPEMVEHADALIAYRTYPHVDMADTGRASRKTSRADAEDEGAVRKGVPAIAVPDSDQLAVHQRPADQGHLPKARGAGERRRADAVVCAGLSGGRFRALRTERVRLWQDTGRRRRRGRQTGGADRRPRGRFRRPDLFARRRRPPRDGTGEDRPKADHHRRHPGQSGRRRRFRHHGHAARAGPQQRDPRRHRRDLRSAIGQGRACKPASAPP